MDPSRWTKVQEIFLEAVDQPPAERAVYLAAACDGDADLRHEVDSLLRAEPG